MHVISKKKIIEFIMVHPNSKSSLEAWYKIIKNTDFDHFNDLQKVFSTADQVEKFTVFNIGGNNYRLIAAIHYNRNKLYIRHILTHAEYDKEKWKGD